MLMSKAKVRIWIHLEVINTKTMITWNQMKLPKEEVEFEE